MLILAIETSCDETAAAVVEDGQRILSNVISSQIEIHAQYGGVVPEIASRHHIQNISVVVDQALQEAGLTFDDIDAIAVTYGPGLVGALLIGVSYAKALAFALGKPLVKVHHIAGHILANSLAYPLLKPPYICLVASGGHSHIVKVTGWAQSDYEVLGQTRDDAAGEAFDKIARVLGLGYPGGPLIDALSKTGNAQSIKFPRVTFADQPYDFSFSGVKTSVINYLHNAQQKGEDVNNADIAASFQQAVVEVLTEKTFLAAQHQNIHVVALAGGVAANQALRKAMTEKAEKLGMTFYVPPMIMCTDNAAMIAEAGFYQAQSGLFSVLSLIAVPNL
ncbi:MAG: tRNA (adenosine(37)-N6)-threonylcarbamoyltransferase complex transferase subunit TsaD, partial [Hyphomonadaceae bacterium]|nr:tRNA (adenosine(37)-N6)-threonylcarbamoyltransferase complex transferase subunit TsaD [Clostridia bacterium]